MNTENQTSKKSEESDLQDNKIVADILIQNALDNEATGGRSVL